MVLKNDRKKDKDKKLEVEELLGSLAEERFALLINLGKKISDWRADEKMQTGEYKMVYLVTAADCVSVNSSLPQARPFLRVVF